MAGREARVKHGCATSVEASPAPTESNQNEDHKEKKKIRRNLEDDVSKSAKWQHIWLKFWRKGEERAPSKAAGVGGFPFLFKDVACASLWLGRGGGPPVVGWGLSETVAGEPGLHLVEKPTATPRTKLGATQLQSERRHRLWVQRECHTPVTRPGPQSRRIGDNHGSQKASSTQKHAINQSFIIHHHSDRHSLTPPSPPQHSSSSSKTNQRQRTTRKIE